MKEQYQLHNDILNMCMRFLTAFSVMAFLVLVGTGNPSIVLMLFYLIPAVAIIYLVEKYSRQAWIYFLLNILLIAVYILVFNNPTLKAISGLYILTEALIQFFERRKPEKRNTFPLLLLIIMVMYYFCKYSYHDVPWLRIYFFYSVVAFILLYLLNMYFLNFDVYINKHKDKANMPLKQIKLSNNIIIAVFAYLSYMVMLILSQLSYQSILNALWRLIKPLLQAFFGWLSKAPEEQKRRIIENKQQLNQGSMIAEEVQRKPSKILIAISTFIYNFIIVLMVAAVIAFFFYSLYRLYRYFYQKKFDTAKKEEKKEFISPFEQEKLDPQENRKTARHSIFSFFVRSNNDRIRKHYFKAVITHTKQEEKLRYLVPRQLTKYAMNKNSESTLLKEITDPKKEAELTSLYEKARYSNKECSKDEWHSVKNLLK